MNHRMRRIVETLACERRYGIADAKGAEYSGKGSTYKDTGADTLANFKNVAERIGGTPEQVLMTYLLKHIDSINTAVREAGMYTGQDENGYTAAARSQQARIYAAGEGIVSRLDDARNYLDLLECLLIDNDHIETVRDAEGEMYAQIGLGAVEMVFPARQPGQDDSLAFSGPRTGYGQNLPADLTHEAGVLRAENELKAAKITNPARWVNPEPKAYPLKSPAEMDAAHYDAVDVVEREMLEAEGLVECLDGVWRPAASKDASVKNPGEVQTPIYCKPAVFEPTMDSVRRDYEETGELGA